MRGVLTLARGAFRLSAARFGLFALAVLAAVLVQSFARNRGSGLASTTVPSLPLAAAIAVIVWASALEKAAWLTRAFSTTARWYASGFTAVVVALVAESLAGALDPTPGGEGLEALLRALALGATVPLVMALRTTARTRLLVLTALIWVVPCAALQFGGVAAAAASPPVICGYTLDSAQRFGLDLAPMAALLTTFALIRTRSLQ